MRRRKGQGGIIKVELFDFVTSENGLAVRVDGQSSGAA
jgi:hypothetical protein